MVSTPEKTIKAKNSKTSLKNDETNTKQNLNKKQKEKNKKIKSGETSLKQPKQQKEEMVKVRRPVLNDNKKVEDETKPKAVQPLAQRTYGGVYVLIAFGLSLTYFGYNLAVIAFNLQTVPEMMFSNFWLLFIPCYAFLAIFTFTCIFKPASKTSIVFAFISFFIACAGCVLHLMYN